tara:strand:+ start:259 stop:531 length:273 start_codon:yes stop_codon:yes gene_type:complete
MEQNKLDKAMQYVGYTVTTLLIIGISFYLITFQSVDSCIEMFLNEEMDASDVKNDCPNLTKDDLVRALIDADNLTREEREYLLVDITENY